MRGKINKLERLLPEGLIVDSAWLNEHGYYNSLRSRYVSSGWLEQPARRVYRRPRGELNWQLVVLSLQTLLDYQLIVGGRTSLELQGYTHYLSQQLRDIHLYGTTKPPTWLNSLELGVTFHFHSAERLFDYAPFYSNNLKPGGGPEIDDRVRAGIVEQPYGHWRWPLLLSTPERAVLEMMDELPDHESFHHIDMVMEGLTNLRPRMLQRLLADCRSAKVKRLFFFFAERHKHAWLDRLDRNAFDFGKGNRRLVKGGRYDAVHQITVPKDL